MRLWRQDVFGPKGLHVFWGTSQREVIQRAHAFSQEMREAGHTVTKGARYTTDITPTKRGIIEWLNRNHRIE